MWPFTKFSRASLPSRCIVESFYLQMASASWTAETATENEVAECVRLLSEGVPIEQASQEFFPPSLMHKRMGEFVSRHCIGSRTPGYRLVTDLKFIKSAYDNYKSIVTIPTEIEERERMYSDVRATTSEQVCI